MSRASAGVEVGVFRARRAAQAEETVEASLWPMCWSRDGKIEAAEEGPRVWRPFCASWKSWGSIVRTQGSTEGLEPGSALGFISFER